MNMWKKGIAMLFVFFVTVGSSKLNVSAAGCTHTDTNGRPGNIDIHPTITR